MRRYKYIFLFLGALAIVTKTSAQPTKGITTEYGGSIMLSSYFGDLKTGLSSNQNVLLYYFSFSPQTARPALSLVMRTNFSRRFAFRTSLTQATLIGNDAYSFDAGRNSRNLSFKSPLTEAAGIFEYNLFRFGNYRGGHTFSPFVGIGISVFKFNPKGFYQGEWVSLQPLSTEGQGLPEYPERKPYSLVGVGLPLVLGFKFAPTKQLRITFEYGYRLTQTDYIDDVSTTYVDNGILAERKGLLAAALADRGSEYNPDAPLRPSGAKRGEPKNNDGYFLMGATVTYFPFKSSCPRWKKR